MGNHYDSDGNRNRIDHPGGAFFTYLLDGLGPTIWLHVQGNDRRPRSAGDGGLGRDRLHQRQPDGRPCL